MGDQYDGEGGGRIKGRKRERVRGGKKKRLVCGVNQFFIKVQGAGQWFISLKGVSNQ